MPWFRQMHTSSYSKMLVICPSGQETGEEQIDEMTLPDQTSGLNTIPQELSEQLSKSNAVLFIGMGLSIGAGLPGWGALIRPLAERVGYTEDDLLKAAQFYENRNGRHALISYLRDQLDTTGIEPTENHDLLARLPINIVFTTNFDDLLERAYRKAGRSVNLVVGAAELPFWDESKVNLVKLHGTCDRPDSFIITERDYNTIYRSNALIVQQLNALLATKTFLFIGYSVSDPDFNQIYDQLSIDLGRHQRRPYLVTFDVDEFKMEDLEQRGYHVISLSGEGDRNAQLAEWLRALLDTVAGPISEAVPPPPSVASRPQPGPAVSQPSKPAHGEGDMNYERGLQMLETFVKPEDEESWRDFKLYKGQLLENLRDERRFGTTETLRNERFRIVDKLNPLALRLTGLSFTDLCLGKQPLPTVQSAVDVQEVIERLHRIEDKLDQGRVEDRQAATQILDAIAHNQVEQAKAAQMVAELRTWAQTVQQVGLPLNPELRTALDALTEHTGGVYQYLEMALPIIPGILSYKVELGSQHQLDLKAIWQRIKTHLGKGSKGNGASTGPEPLYGAGNRWAVLVGINEHEDRANYGQLHVCVKDVHTIREQLVAGGFDSARIRLLTDDTPELPTRDNILVALKAVADATEPDDLLLFYYSGHGDEDDGESYLVARNGKRLVLSDTAVRVSRVKEIMDQAPARAKVIVLDACHSGADIGGKGPKPMPLEFIRRVFEQAEGLAILASCKQGQLSYEWQTRERSVFTHFLLEALEGQADLDEKGFVTVQDANRHVVNGVKLWASQRNVSQTPTLQYTVAGDIILTRPGTQLPKVTPAPSPRVVVSVPLPENAWSKFQKLAEAREKTPEAYLDLLIDMECEQIKPGTDMRPMPVLTEWPVKQMEVDSAVFGRLKRLGGAPPEHRISKLIRDVTKTDG